MNTGLGFLGSNHDSVSLIVCKISMLATARKYNGRFQIAIFYMGLMIVSRDHPVTNNISTTILVGCYLYDCMTNKSNFHTWDLSGKSACLATTPCIPVINTRFQAGD